MAKTLSGDTRFLLDGAARAHRFELNATPENALSIWIEDRASKKQWQTEALALERFVTADNAVPRATAAIYAELFARCLSTTDAKYKHELVVKGGARSLVLSLPLQMASLELAVEYKFVLEEVPLERVDLLGARVRDLEDHAAAVSEARIRDLEKQNEDLQSQIDDLTKKVEELKALVKKPTPAPAFGARSPFGN